MRCRNLLYYYYYYCAPHSDRPMCVVLQCSSPHCVPHNDRPMCVAVFLTTLCTPQWQTYVCCSVPHHIVYPTVTDLCVLSCSVPHHIVYPTVTDLCVLSCSVPYHIVYPTVTDLCVLSCSVPDHIVPILFILYTKPLTTLIQQHSITNQSFADDTQLYNSYRPD